MTTEIDEQFIEQIVATDTGFEKALGSVLKSVWSAGRQDSFVSALERFAARKGAEIEALCHGHYQHYVHSIEELLAIRLEAEALRDSLGKLNGELQTSGQLLYDTRVEKHEAQKMMLNVGKAIGAIQDCLAAFNAAQRTTLEIADRNFGDALSVLDQLQSSLLRPIEEYSFAVKLQNWIPTQINKIKEYAVDQLKSWLALIREQSLTVGKLAMSQTQSRLERWQRACEDSSEDRLLLAQLELCTLEQNDGFSILDNETVRVDFAPLLRALHLFHQMDRPKEFEQIYTENRRMQAEIIIGMPVSLGSTSDTRSFENYLNQICGFFIIEYFVVNLPQRFHQPGHVEVLWESAMARIDGIVMDSLSLCAEQAFLMKIKWAQVFFMHALEVYSYSVHKLVDTAISLFYRYVELLKSEYNQRIEEAATKDPLVPMSLTVASLETARQQLAFLTEDPRFSEIKSAFPFSASVLSIFNVADEFIKNFYVFLEGLPQHSSELDDIAKKTVDNSLLAEANRVLLDRVEETTELSKVAQIIVDFCCLELMCADIGKLLLARRTRLRSSSIHLHAVAMFASSRQQAESKIFQVVNQQVDRVMDVAARYERMPVSRSLGPSSYVQELARHLSALSTSVLAGLPKSVIDAVHVNCFAYICRRMMEILSDPDVQSMNMMFVSNFEIDVAFLEQYIADLPKEISDVAMEAFGELGQTLRLLMADSVHEYLDPLVRSRKYPRVKTHIAIRILEKIKEPMQKRRSIEDLVLLLH